MALFLGYWIGYNQAEEELSYERRQTQHLIDQIEAIAKIDETTKEVPAQTQRRDAEIRHLKEQLRTLLRKETEPPAQHEYAPKEPKALPPPSEKRPLRSVGAEAKLVIIIDDVSYDHDVAAIRSTGLPLVMSFLPPSARHPESAQLAAKESRYMVHLPLEAIDYNSEELSTLRVPDTEEKISERITELKRLYPRVRYMNNHTGSKFTSDAQAMEKLLSVLKKEGITFVDSRTSAGTKVSQASQKLGLRYIGRDVFLDHQDGVANVKRQIKEAVEKAKKHGSAIAIGHPRPDTIQALRESRSLLSEVKIVGIEEI